MIMVASSLFRQSASLILSLVLFDDRKSRAAEQFQKIRVMEKERFFACGGFGRRALLSGPSNRE
jgi:hypothetical protein